LFLLFRADAGKGAFEKSAPRKHDAGSDEPERHHLRACEAAPRLQVPEELLRAFFIVLVVFIVLIVFVVLVIVLVIVLVLRPDPEKLSLGKRPSESRFLWI
jgi:phage shock protein PspC (stress-responsive transcriptional regulator)